MPGGDKGTSEKFGKVAVLMGGNSAEREISLLSGNAVLNSLHNRRVDVIAIDADKNLITELTDHDIERVFICLHGKNGEDGKVQAVMELINMPYTGSGVLSSALAMDKIRCKQLWMAQKLDTPEFVVLNENVDWQGVIEDLGTVFVKPVNEGSSKGISKVSSATELLKAYQEALHYDSAVIAEQSINGAEYVVTILGERALPVIEIRTENEFYDYEAKYESDDTQYLCPCDLDDEKTDEIKELAWKAYRSIGCYGWGRIDIMQDKAGRFWLLEVNTVPGMTDHSLVPMAAKEAGINFDELVIEILQSSNVDRKGALSW